MKNDQISYPPRGMSKEESARYVGVGVTKFDELVSEGLMPKPKHIGARRVWDRISIDAYFADLPSEGGGLLDSLFQ